MTQNAEYASYDGSAGGQHHRQPCGCIYVAVDVPDDQWIGQGWKRVEPCPAHIDSSGTP